MLVVSVPILGAAAMATVAAAASSPDNNNIQHQQKYRILTNAETGAITHPLVPHKAHLERRRRELFEKYPEYEFDATTTLPPRPHTSRHSQTPIIDNIIESSASLRGNERRNLQQQMGALYQGYGTHYVDLWVGSPAPQRQTVIVDTGSGVTAFPCEECKGCGKDYHTDNYYKESQSKSFRALECNSCFKGYCATMSGDKKCRISMSYAEGSSWSAYEAMDLCYAGGPHDTGLTIEGAQTNMDDVKLDLIDPVEASQFAFELAFGCQVSITGLFITQLADGIMGMENEKTSFWKQMHVKNAIPRQEFSLCFSRNNEAARDGTGAGAMTLGGVDPRLHASPMVFAKNQKASGFYAVHLKAVYLREGGGVSAQTDKGHMGKLHKLNIDDVALNRGNVIVDSGTTDTYFTSAIASTFKATWKDLTGYDYSHRAVSLTEKQLDEMPTIILVMQGFDGATVGDEPTEDPDSVAGYVGSATQLSDNPKDIVLAIPARHYMEFDPDQGKYVPRFYTEESSGSVLGANAMMGHDVFFDVARGRIGFAESSCDYTSLLLSEGDVVSVPPSSNQVSTKKEVPEPETAEETFEAVPEPETAEETIEQEEKEEEEQMEVIEELVEKVVEDAYEEAHEAEEKSESGPDKYPAVEESGTPANDQSSTANANDEPYELFGNDKKPQQGAQNSGFSSMSAEILEDMKHECGSNECRGIAAFFILGAGFIAIMGIRKALARRRIVREYQEAELEISDLALNSDSDSDEGGYVDEPPLHQIT